MSRTADDEYFLKNLPPDGSPIGNKALREKLKWDEDKYWKVRDELLESGSVKRGRGNGGSVSKIEIDAAAINKTTSAVKDPYKDEKSLYDDFKDTIELKFTRDMRLKSYVCEDISSQGSRSTGGLWTRPDIVLIAINSYSYYPGKVMDVITFELKHYKGLTIAGVFETASHSRFATKSYFVVYAPKSVTLPSEFDRFAGECERFGVGLIRFTNPKDYDSFEVLVSPERKDTDPAEMDDFIKTQLSEKSKTKISELLR